MTARSRPPTQASIETELAVSYRNCLAPARVLASYRTFPQRWAFRPYPANTKHATDDLSSAQPQIGWAYHVPHLALQPVLVCRALFAGEVVFPPVSGRRRA